MKLENCLRVGFKVKNNISNLLIAYSLPAGRQVLNLFNSLVT